MTEESVEPWHVRWKAARKARYSSAEKLADALREAGWTGISRFTPQRWELPHGSGGYYPSPDARAALAAMNEDFAALIKDLPPPAPRERRLDVLSRVDQLLSRVDRLQAEVEELRSEVRAQRL